MDEIKQLSRCWLRSNVVSHDRKLSVLGLEPRRVNVRRQHEPICPFGNPCRNTRTTGPDFPYSPPGRKADRLHMAEGRRVEQLRECIETLPCLGLLVVKQVAISSHSKILRRDGDFSPTGDPDARASVDTPLQLPRRFDGILDGTGLARPACHGTATRPVPSDKSGSHLPRTGPRGLHRACPPGRLRSEASNWRTSTPVRHRNSLIPVPSSRSLL